MTDSVGFLQLGQCDAVPASVNWLCTVHVGVMLIIDNAYAVPICCLCLLHISTANGQV